MTFPISVNDGRWEQADFSPKQLGKMQFACLISFLCSYKG